MCFFSDASTSSFFASEKSDCSEEVPKLCLESELAITVNIMGVSAIECSVL